MAVLKFDKEQVRKIVAHTLANPEMSPTFESMANSKFWKAGAKPDEHGWVKPEDVDMTKISPYVTLVKDAGIYLMAGSKVTLEPEEPETTLVNFVVYAETYGADADYDHILDAAGGDDFAEHLPLGWFVKAVESSEKYIKLKLTSNNISLVS